MNKEETIHSRLNNALLFAAVMFIAFGYFFLNKPTGNIHVLATSLDNFIPFVPIFSFFYLLFLPIFWLVFLYSFLSKKKFTSLAITIITIHLISYLFYIFYQTEVIRPEVIGNSFFDSVVRFIYDNDAPYNCFPSLHSALATTMASYLVFIKNKYAVIGILFACLVILSTLFVKQHYIADAISGVLLGLGVAFILFKK